MVLLEQQGINEKADLILEENDIEMTGMGSLPESLKQNTLQPSSEAPAWTCRGKGVVAITGDGLSPS